MDSDKITIKEIAQICSVGTSTVSRVINNMEGVKEETRQLVLEAIKEYNYIPNTSAQNLKRITSLTIGIIVKEFTNPFFAQMINIIENELRKNGYSSAILPVKSESNEVKDALPFCKEKNLEGLIFLGGRFNHSKKTLEKIKIPFVFVTVSNKFGECNEDIYSSISVDDELEAYKGVKYLYDLGHRKIAFVGIDNNDSSISRLRFNGYRKALKDLKIDFNEKLVLETKKFDMSTVFQATNDFIKNGVKFSAIFTISDAMAVAINKSLLTNGNLVPDDVSVLGFDGIEIGEFLSPQLSTLKQPTKLMAIESSNLILDLISGKSNNKHLTFETTIIKGGTCKKYNKN